MKKHLWLCWILPPSPPKSASNDQSANRDGLLQPTLVNSCGKWTIDIFWTSRATCSISMLSQSLAWKWSWPHWSRRRFKSTFVAWITEAPFQEQKSASGGFWPPQLLARLLVTTQQRRSDLFNDKRRHLSKLYELTNFPLAFASLLTKYSANCSQVFQGSCTSKELGAKVIIKEAEVETELLRFILENARYILEHLPTLCLLHPQWPDHARARASWCSHEDPQSQFII